MRFSCFATFDFSSKVGEKGERSDNFQKNKSQPEAKKIKNKTGKSPGLFGSFLDAKLSVALSTICNHKHTCNVL